MVVSNRILLLQRSVCRSYVSFGDGSCFRFHSCKHGNLVHLVQEGLPPQVLPKVFLKLGLGGGQLLRISQRNIFAKAALFERTYEFEKKNNSAFPRPIFGEYPWCDIHAG